MNTEVICKKGQQCLYFPRKLNLFNIDKVMLSLHIFYTICSHLLLPGMEASVLGIKTSHFVKVADWLSTVILGDRLLEAGHPEGRVYIGCK